MAKNNAKMIDLSTLIAAGVDPKTGLPIKFNTTGSKDNIKLMLRIIDEQNAVNRYTWYNLPCNLSSQELERMLYYKGQLAFFYFKELDQFYFMPYALDGTIDFYGRYNHIHPVPMTSGSETDSKVDGKQLTLLSKMHLKCIYAPVVYEDEINKEMLEDSCVLIHDYTKQLAQTIIPRQIVNDSLIDYMSNIIPYVDTNTLASLGIKGMRVNDADQSTSVSEASKNIKSSALNGIVYTPIVGAGVDWQELTDNAYVGQQLLMTFEALDNFRLTALGIVNGTMNEKKAHLLESENVTNNVSALMINNDGLAIRQNFCNIVNSIWDLGIWCEPSEAASQVDMNGDGGLWDENDEGQYSGIDDSEEGGEENVD